MFSVEENEENGEQEADNEVDEEEEEGGEEEEEEEEGDGEYPCPSHFGGPLPWPLAQGESWGLPEWGLWTTCNWACTRGVRTFLVLG